MTKNEFARITGFSAAKVRKLADKGIFTVPGIGTFEARKTGDKRTSKIDIVPADPAKTEQEEENIESLASAKLKKLQLETKVLNLRLEDMRRQIEEEYSKELCSRIKIILDDICKVLKECELNSIQTEKITAAIKESIGRLPN